VTLLRRSRGFLVTLLTLGMLTAVLAPILDERRLIDVTLIYLLVTLVAAARWGYREGIVAAVVANLLVNFFFVPPLHRFSVHEPENLVALLLFLAVAAVGAFMLSRLKAQVVRANARQAETAVLLELTRGISQAQTPRQAIDRLCGVVARALGARGCAILSGEQLAVSGSTVDEASGRAPTRDEAAVAREALRRGEVARLGPTSPDGKWLTFLPLQGATPAVMKLIGEQGLSLESPLVQALSNEAALALERARLSREAERANALERADEFKSVLLSSVSHDLRSPLTAIKAAVSSLRDEQIAWSDDDRRAFLETIESQTDRLTTTIANLLQMSRLEGGIVRPKIEAIEVAPLLAEAAVASAAIAGGRVVSEGTPEGLWVKADYGLLTQVIANLVENALGYSTPGSMITLSAAGVPGRVRISVANEGPGIAPDDLPHIFEKFYRGRSSRNVKGSGLGLAMVKSMVELCGGTVSVASTDACTTFTISLPVASAPR